MSRRPFVAGNWKMHHGGASGCTLAADIARGVGTRKDVIVVVAPPFTALAAVASVVHEVAGTSVGVAAQNVHPKAQGAFTGEISPAMLVEAGCQWVIVGHSERRQLFGETDASVREKTEAVLAAGLGPIVCVGETLAEREANQTLEVVHRQIDAVVDVLAGAVGRCAVAYEPVWAIGTGKVAGPEQAEEVHHALRLRLGRKSAELAEKTWILYGGSVKPDNAAGLLACEHVDGALVGGASLEAAAFLAIVNAATT